MDEEFVGLPYFSSSPHKIISSTPSPEPILESNVPRASSLEKETSNIPTVLQVYSGKKIHSDPLQVQKLNQLLVLK